MSFDSGFFVGNRARLRELFTGEAPIVLTANGLLQKIGDEAYPFRQDGSFRYLTGCDIHDAILVMDKGKEYLIVPGRDESIEKFDGTVDKTALAATSGISDIVNEKEGWRRLKLRLGKAQYVATLAANPAYVEFFGMYTNPARRQLIKRLKEVSSHLELLDLRPHLSRMRMVKHPAELEAIQRAIDITSSTLKEVTRPSRLGKYAFEYEIEADVAYGFRKRGADGHGFEPVVASGKNACTMHYLANNSPLSSDELVTMDVGARASGYTADIARTVALGKPTQRQRQVHQAVVQALEYALGLLKPGLLLADYEKEMEMFIGEKLRELGLIKSITPEAVREYSPHRTSHFLGIDVHDGGDYDRPLEPGVVLAVEPGIYVPSEGIGVRIEDNAVITQDGAENLSEKLPRDL